MTASQRAWRTSAGRRQLDSMCKRTRFGGPLQQALAGWLRHQCFAERVGEFVTDRLRRRLGSKQGTPDAWNSGRPASLDGRSQPSARSCDRHRSAYPRARDGSHPMAEPHLAGAAVRDVLFRVGAVPVAKPLGRQRRAALRSRLKFLGNHCHDLLALRFDQQYLAFHHCGFQAFCLWHDISDRCRHRNKHYPARYL